MAARPRTARFDELKISDLSIPELIRLHGKEAHLPRSFMLRLQDGVRRHLDFMARLQRDGAWSMPVYAWPYLLPGGTSYRTFFLTDTQVSVTHARNGTPGAAMLYLYAYYVLGDRSCPEVAENAGDCLRAAQQPEGYWMGGYDRRTASPPGSAGKTGRPKTSGAA